MELFIPSAARGTTSVGVSSGLSPAPHAEPQADGADSSFFFHPNRLESAMFITSIMVFRELLLSVFTILRTFFPNTSTHFFITESLFVTILKPCAFLDYNLNITVKLKLLEWSDRMLTKEEMPACPVATTVSLIGSKWKLLIMHSCLAAPGVLMN